MKRLLSPCLGIASLLIPLMSFGSDSPSTSAKAPAPPEEAIVKIVLHPMPETRPALKYQLLPPFLDRRPGNAAVRWNRLPAEQTQFLAEFNKERGIWDKTEKWMALPLGDPREKEMRAKEPAINQLLESGLFSEMDYAARFESCDWELPLRQGRVFEMLIPEVQMTRTWGRMLAAKAHAEIADKKYAEAARTLQTGFALARHTARGQTLIHGLVGVAIATQMTNQVEKLMQQPDGPNLYWALSTLPAPLIDFRDACDFESNGLLLQFTALQNLDEKELSRVQWNALLAKFVHNFFELGNLIGNQKEHGIGDWKEATMVATVLYGYPRAKQYLIDRGRKKAEVDAMPESQVVLLYTLDVYQTTRDDLFKAMCLPYPEAKIQLERAEAQKKERRKDELIPVSMILPTMLSVKQSETRVQWTIARLRILEALRMYAAGHEGKLPEQLSDIREVPVPSNPFDDKPFSYHRDGDRAELGCESGPRNLPWRYEITMARKP